MSKFVLCQCVSLRARPKFKYGKMENPLLNIYIYIYIFFFYQGFLHRQWRFTGQQRKGGDHLLFHSTTSTRSQTLRHLYATLHVRWLSRIFNRNACVYQTATRWDLPPYRVTIWVIDWWCNVCLFTWSIDTRLLLQRIGIENRWIWTRIEYHPWVTNEPTNQVWNLIGNLWGNSYIPYLLLNHG